MYIELFKEYITFKIKLKFFNYNFEPVFFDPKSGRKERVFATKDMCEGLK